MNFLSYNRTSSKVQSIHRSCHIQGNLTKNGHCTNALKNLQAKKKTTTIRIQKAKKILIPPESKETTSIQSMTTIKKTPLALITQLKNPTTILRKNVKFAKKNARHLILYPFSDEDDKYYDKSYKSNSQYSKKDDNVVYYEKKDKYSKNYENGKSGYGKSDDYYKGSEKTQYSQRSGGYQRDGGYKSKDKHTSSETKGSDAANESYIHYQKRDEPSKHETKPEPKVKTENAPKEKETKHVRFDDEKKTEKDVVKEEERTKHESKKPRNAPGAHVQYVQKEEPKSSQTSEQKKQTEDSSSKKNQQFFEKQTPVKGVETQQATSGQSSNQTPQTTGTTQAAAANTSGNAQTSSTSQPQASGSQIPTQQQQPIIVQQQPQVLVPYNPLSVISNQGQKDMPQMFQMPYIVFPLSNGTAIVQPLYIPVSSVNVLCC